MKTFGRATVSEFLGDLVVYRNLAPMDARLPSLDALRATVGLPPGRIPRKSEPDYAQVIVHMLRKARALYESGTAIERLIFVGDTRLNDGTAYANICQAGGWPGLAFIGSETTEPPSVEVVSTETGEPLYLSNRWAALHDFDRYCAAQGLPVDERAAVIVDLDKTALGARGRNAHVIDQARVQAVRDTVADLLGAAFSEAAFRDAYDRINQVEFHPFTTDNQDYLAYICLILGSGLYDLATLVGAIRNGQISSFEQFISQVDERTNALPAALADIHGDIYTHVQAGDPTPFKAFRRNEYLTTVGRMGQLEDTAAVETLLADEIVLTQEVRALALDWRARGALLFGLSDKPDEASVPTPELVAQGYVPIHQTETHAVGT
ncbi:MAG: hypothetical protein ACE5FI_10915 [Anaerolineales bacterium]